MAVLFKSVQPSGVITASAYSANDAIASAFPVPVEVGNLGGVIPDMNLVILSASGTAQMRAHFYLTQPSALGLSGNPWQLAPQDITAYLGFEEITGWVSAGPERYVGRVYPGKGYAIDGQKQVYCQLQAMGSCGFGNTANPLYVNTLSIGD